MHMVSLFGSISACLSAGAHKIIHFLAVNLRHYPPREETAYGPFISPRVRGVA